MVHVAIRCWTASMMLMLGLTPLLYALHWSLGQMGRDTSSTPYLLNTPQGWFISKNSGGRTGREMRAYSVPSRVKSSNLSWGNFKLIQWQTKDFIYTLDFPRMSKSWANGLRTTFTLFRGLSVMWALWSSLIKLQVLLDRIWINSESIQSKKLILKKGKLSSKFLQLKGLLFKGAPLVFAIIKAFLMTQQGAVSVGGTETSRIMRWCWTNLNQCT